jgi:FkbM family methyltransferase
MIRRTLRHFTRPELNESRAKIKNWLMPLLRPDPIIVEAGSHWGEDTIWLGRYWPMGTVHAFEPAPFLYGKTKEHTSWMRNVHRYPLALSDRVETVEMYLSGGNNNASNSILPPKDHLQEYPHIQFDKKILVPTITLELWAQQWAVPRVDFLWLDIQGAELRALKGMGKLIDTVKAMHLEVQTREMYDGAELYPEVRAWVEARGFKVAMESFDRGQGDLFLQR